MTSKLLTAELAYGMYERLDPDLPDEFDPLAQAMVRHSGVFDLKDRRNGNAIVATATNAMALRKMQAQLNTLVVLDGRYLA